MSDMAAEPKRILMVDDDVALLRIVREALVASLRCEVDTSPKPEYAFELALKKVSKLRINWFWQRGFFSCQAFRDQSFARKNQSRCSRDPVGSLIAGESARTTFGEQLSLGFQPIRIRIAGKIESVPSLRNEVGARLNLFVRWIQAERSCCWRY